MNLIVSTTTIQDKILTIRGKQVMLDKDLAELYCVRTKVLNQAVKRNNERFPADFTFQLTANEKNELVTNCDRLRNLKHSVNLPFVFTEQGVATISGVLKSKRAIEVNIQIMRAFVTMRSFISKNATLFARLDKVEQKQLVHEQKFEEVFSALTSHIPKQGIFFDGQVFDAYSFVSDLIRSAKKSIILIDNYIDDSVLLILSKRKSKVPATILTKTISQQLKLDLKKHNEQYAPITIKTFNKTHDRFLLIDEKMYHIGASLKDLGKKWFAFTKLDKETLQAIQEHIYRTTSS